MSIKTFFSTYTEKFSTNYHNDRWNGSMLRRNEGLPWWHCQRIRLYVCGHVTNIWLNCCYAQAVNNKAHLTPIAGSNHRPIQLNLFAILSSGQTDCVCGAAAKDKPRTFATSPCPKVSPRQQSRVQRSREHLHLQAWSPLLGIQYLMHRQGLIWMEMKWLGSKVN